MKSILVLFVVLSSVSVQATDWEKELAADIVTLDSNKQSLDEYFLMKFKSENGSANNIQVGIHSEGPTGVISRDNFVGITTMFYTMIIAGMVNLAECEFEDLEAPIGKVDIEINLYMTKEGCQIEIHDVNSNQKNKQTTKWSELFGEK